MWLSGELVMYPHGVQGMEKILADGRPCDISLRGLGIALLRKVMIVVEGAG